MALTSYTTLLSSIADWLDRDDLDSVSDTLVDLAEARIYRECRFRFMESSLSETISSGVVAIPSDFLELKTAYIDGTPTLPLEPADAQAIYRMYPQRSADSKPCYIAPEGDNFIFGPYPDSTYTLKATYYAKPTALSTSNQSNWLITNAPDMLLYGCLVHSAPYIGHDERLPLWESAYQEAKSRAVAADKRERFPSELPLMQVLG